MRSLDEIFAETFPQGGPVATMQYQNTVGWDSLNHMVLCAKIEENFDIMLEINEIADMSSFVKAQAIVEKHRAK